MPQILIKSVSGGEIQKAVNLFVDLFDHCFPVIASLVEPAAYLRERSQYAVLPDAPVNDQFGCETVHDLFSFGSDFSFPVNGSIKCGFGQLQSLPAKQ